jgi:hypothetical protein
VCQRHLSYSNMCCCSICSKQDSNADLHIRNSVKNSQSQFTYQADGQEKKMTSNFDKEVHNSYIYAAFAFDAPVCRICQRSGKITRLNLPCLEWQQIDLPEPRCFLLQTTGMSSIHARIRHGDAGLGFRVQKSLARPREPFELAATCTMIR